MVEFVRLFIVIVGNLLTISWIISCAINWVPNDDDRFKGFFGGCLNDLQIVHSIVYFLFFVNEFIQSARPFRPGFPGED